ncbi:hypothetical protein [Amphritea sp. HPY]|uniref:hypothetical protein n=1 Tax=Amphritea sp. HPY TaxID=3421652 RepID=UPI003D7DECBF
MLLRFNNTFTGFILKACALASAFLSIQISAFELTESTEVHGFVSQSYISTDGNNYFGQSKDGSFDFREAGINIIHEATPDLHFAAQVISRKAGKTNDGSPHLDYALMDYNLFDENGWRSGIRLGRTKTPYGFYNLTRDIPNARSGVSVPSSIYFEQLRNSLISTDGGNFYSNLNRDWGSLSFDLYSGQTETDVEMEYYVLQQDLPGQFDDATMRGARLLYENMGGSLRLALTYAHPEFDYQPGSFDPFSAGHVASDMLLYSVQYNLEKWSLTAEYLTADNEVTAFGVLPDRFSNTEAFYIQGDYRINSDLTVYLRYEEQTLDTKDPDGTQFYQPLFGAAHIAFGKNTVLGGRWDFADNWLIRGEIHDTRGTLWLPKSDNPSLPERNEKWQMLVLQLVYSF